MRYKGYVAEAKYDRRIKQHFGELIGIRDVVTFQARSIAELPEAFRESVDDYLAFCQARGEKPDRPRR